MGVWPWHDFWPLGFEGLSFALHVVLLRAVFGFALLGTYVFISLGSGWGQWEWRLDCFVPWWGPGVACWVVSFVLRVSALASPTAWCLCQWVGWRVSGVVGGSGLGAFNYWTTLVPLITISHFSHQSVVLLLSLKVTHQCFCLHDFDFSLISYLVDHNW